MWSKKPGHREDRSTTDGWQPDASRSSTWLWETNKSYNRRLTTLGVPTNLVKDDGYLRRKPTGSLNVVKPFPREDISPTDIDVGSNILQKRTPSPTHETKAENLSCSHGYSDVVMPNVTASPPVVPAQMTEISITPEAYPAAPKSPDPESPQTRQTYHESSIDRKESSSETSVGTSHPRIEATDDPMSTPFDILWKRYQRQRIFTWTLRSEVHRVRNKLRETQEVKAVADDALFRFVMGEKLLGPDFGARYSLLHQKKLPDLMQDCQAIRDEYGPLEDDCIRLEDRLSNEESKQNELEAEFHKRLEQRLPDLQVEPTTQHLRDTSPGPGAVLEDLKVTNLHPLATQFLSKLGDMYLLDEQYNDLVDEKQYLEEEAVRRQNINLPLTANDQAFLDNYETAEQSLSQRLDVIETEVEVMRKDCLARGLIDEYDEPTTLMSQEETHFKEEKDLNPENNVSEYAKYPVLLPRPGSRQEVEVDMESLVASKNDQPQSRVNQWLLQQLRSSPLDVRLLASLFEDEGGGETNDRWQFYVLSVWFTDDTLSGTTALEAYSSSLTTHAPPRSSNSSIYHF
jgi:hypothetical protein